MSTNPQPNPEEKRVPLKKLTFGGKVAAICTGIYLLRVPLGIACLTFLLPMISLCKWGPWAMVRGAFDASWKSIFFLSATLGFVVFSLTMNTRVILCCGSLRYRIPKMGKEATKGFEGVLFLVYVAAAAPTVPACIVLACDQQMGMAGWIGYLSLGSLGLLLSLMALGMAVEPRKVPAAVQIAMAKTRQAAAVAAKATVVAAPAGWLERRAQTVVNALENWFGEGFGKEKAEDGESAKEHHVVAWKLGILALIFYVAFAFWPPRDVPAIIYVLLFLLTACWFLSAATFVLDRYRIPLFTVIAVWLLAMKFFPFSDYFFATTSSPAKLPTAGELLAKAPSPIVVAAEGGGIHSGSWAVEVLSRLEELSLSASELPPGVNGKGKPPKFSRYVRAVSGVSGGSYGLLFFAAAYDGSSGGLPPSTEARDGMGQPIQVNTPQRMRDLVHRPSLGPVVHDLVYVDVWHDLFPLWRFGGRSGRMERSWIEGMNLADKGGTPQTSLATWAENAKDGGRPVVLFNCTSVETGRPVVFGTSLVSDWNFNAQEGRQPGVTVPVSTGARLSAAFPYVNPAARPEDSDAITRVEHHVDGGYYDNFGMVPLTQWLQDGFKELDRGHKQDANPKRILIIQIRYKDGPSAKKTPGRGSLFQLIAPLQGLYNVRTTGQKLRNNEEFAIFSNYWKQNKLDVRNAAFEFDLDAPLSWYLTQRDVDDLTAKGRDINSQYDAYCKGLNDTVNLVNWENLSDEQRQRADKLKADKPLGAAAYQVMKFLWEAAAAAEE